MGTDIHLYVERRNAEGKWEYIPEVPSRRCSWCNGEKHYEGRPNDKCYSCGAAHGREPTGETTEPYGGRNYDLFAILADVRNGYGFAGVDTGDGFRPMLATKRNKVSGEWEGARRGLPEDMSPEVSYIARDVLREQRAEDVALAEDAATFEGNAFARDLDIEPERPASFGPPPANADDYDEAVGWIGDHSFNWVTLREVLDCDWSQKTKHRGVVSVRQYVAWVQAGRKGPPPEGWSGGVSGQNVVDVSVEEMDRLLATGDAIPLDEDAEHLRRTRGLPAYYTQVEWEETYRESVGGDWFRFLDSLSSLGKPEDIRFVFGFDS